MNTLQLSATAPSSHITDSNLFFIEITERYHDLYRSATAIIDQIDHNPNINLIASQCTALNNQRTLLSVFDEEMFRILELAGDQLVDTPLLQNYQVAFSKASLACNNLFDKLHTLRLQFVKKQQKVQS
jgi:hypothetical protein